MRCVERYRTHVPSSSFSNTIFPRANSGVNIILFTGIRTCVRASSGTGKHQGGEKLGRYGYKFIRSSEPPGNRRTSSLPGSRECRYYCVIPTFGISRRDPSKYTGGNLFRNLGGGAYCGKNTVTWTVQGVLQLMLFALCRYRQVHDDPWSTAVRRGVPTTGTVDCFCGIEVRGEHELLAPETETVSRAIQGSTVGE